MTAPKLPTPSGPLPERRQGTDRRATRPQGTPEVSASGEAPAKAPFAPGALESAVPLRDALTGIGEMLNLPRKEPTRPDGVPAVGGGSRATQAGGTRAVTASMAAIEANRRKRSRLVIGLLSAVTMLVAAAGAWLVLQNPVLPRQRMPDDLLATWRSTHPKYAQSSMTITPEEITFITVDPTALPPAKPVVMHHRITGFQTETRGDTSDVVLTYDVDGEGVELRARLIGGMAPRLDFTRPEGLSWYSSAPPP